MGGAEISAAPSNEDFSAVMLAHFSNLENWHHVRICAAINDMSQELSDQKIALTPTNYFLATCASLDRADQNFGDLLDALLTIMPFFIDRVSNSVLETKYVYLSALLIQSLGQKSVGINGVIPALKFASRLLTVREKVEWHELAQLYDLLLTFIIDDRPQVRKESHWCLREVLEHFQLVPALASPASEAITYIFEWFLLQISNEQNDFFPEASNAAREKALYIVDALNICLPYMSSTPDYFPYLLELIIHPPPPHLS